MRRDKLRLARRHRVSRWGAWRILCMRERSRRDRGVLVVDCKRSENRNGKCWRVVYCWCSVVKLRRTPERPANSTHQRCTPRWLTVRLGPLPIFVTSASLSVRGPRGCLHDAAVLPFYTIELLEKRVIHVVTKWQRRLSWHCWRRKQQLGGWAWVIIGRPCIEGRIESVTGGPGAGGCLNRGRIHSNVGH